jgi:hypothetical protein
LLGVIFGLVGAGLAIVPGALVVGLPFAGIAVLFLCTGTPLLGWRYRIARRTMLVLSQGEVAQGKIVSVHQNHHVRVNGRYPWTMAYRFAVSGDHYRGKVTTLSRPDLSQQAGRPVHVLYMRDDPAQNTLYPSPYSYNGVG